MGRLLTGFDWGGTGIGTPDQWPPELRAYVDMVLGCRVPMMLGWGRDLRLIYNDGYLPILLAKHPAVWKPGREVFAEIWDLVGPLLEGVFDSGKAVFRENQLIPLARRGRPEEAYFTFSYSPLRTSDGSVAGVLSTAVETTTEVVGARRDALLHRLADHSGDLPVAELLEWVSRALAGSSPDLPFHAVAWREEDGGYRIVAHSDAPSPGHWRETPFPLPSAELRGWQGERLPLLLSLASFVDVRDPGGNGTTDGAEDGESSDDPTHPGRPARDQVAILPIGAELHSASDLPPGLLILGLAPMLPWDEGYRRFLRRVGGRVSALLEATRIRELEVGGLHDEYRELFENAPNGIVLGTPCGRILKANPASAQILGERVEALLDRPLDGLLRRGDEAVDLEHLTSGEDGRFQGRLEVIGGDGNPIPCAVTARRYRTAPGDDRMLVAFSDNRPRLALEAQLRQALELESVGKLAGGVAHDFNNLLTVIDTQVELLRLDLPDDATIRSDLDVLKDASARAATLTRRLLDFARRSQASAELLDPAEALRGMAPLLRRLAGSATELVYDLEDDLPSIRISPHQFEQIVFNLVGNAAEALTGTSSRPGTVSLRLARAVLPEGGEGVAIRVADDGPGIPPSVMDLIWDSFFTTKPHGSGIGLSTVRLIAEGLGGAAHASNRSEGGAVFTVTLPAAGATTPSRVATPIVADTEAEDVAGRHVLLLEDEPTLRRAVTRILTSAGVEVTAARSGDEALLHLEADRPDLLVTDVVMPLMSGFELARRARTLHPGLPILLVSGYAGDEGIPEDLRNDIDFLPKPFRREELLEAVGTVIGKG